MRGMFNGCRNLETLNLSNFDTSKVTNMYEMFYRCSKLQTLDISNFNIASSCDVENMLTDCTSLRHIYSPKINYVAIALPKGLTFYLDDARVSEIAVNTSGNSKYYIAVKDGYLSKNWKNSITNISSVQSILFTSDSSKIPTGITGISVGAEEDGTTAWTSDCDTLDVKLYQSGTSLVVYCAGNLCVVDAQRMFNGIGGFSRLTSLTLDNFDTSRVTSMENMFSDCRNLETLNLSNFDTSKVTSMAGMFEGCSNLKTLNLSNFDTSRVTYMQSMFLDCRNLNTLNLSNFDTSMVTCMNSMFSGCKNLNTLNLSNFDTLKVTDMAHMFDDCRNLETLNLSNFDTSRVTSMWNMFRDCRKLQTLNISSFNIASGCTVTGMLTNCTSLRDIYSPKINNVAIALPEGLTFYLDNKQVSEIAVNTSGNSRYYTTVKGSM